MRQPAELDRRMLDQISKQSGLSQDFRNEYMVVLTGIINDHQAEEFMKEIRDSVESKGCLIKKYEERYPKEKFFGVITKEAKPKIAELDALVDQCNEIYLKLEADQNLNDSQRVAAIKEQIHPLIKQMETIIFGEKTDLEEMRKKIQKIYGHAF